MKKILIFWLIAIGMANAQFRIGVINADTNTRPALDLTALAWKNNNLYLVKPIGNTVKFLQNDNRLFVGDNNRVGVGTKTPTHDFTVVGNAKIGGSLQVGLGAGLIRSNADGLLSTTTLSTNDLPYLGGLYLPLLGGGNVNGDLTISGNLHLNNIPDLKAAINAKSKILVSSDEVETSGLSPMLLYSEYDYIFDTFVGKIYKYEHRDPPELPFLSEIGTFASKDELNQKFDNTNTVFEPPLSFLQLTNPSTGAVTNSVGIPQSSQYGSGYLSSTDWITFNTKQNQINGNGLVRATGTSISFDNNSYLTTSSAASTYAGLASNNNFTGSNLFLTPIFANSTSTSAYSTITGAWSNTGNLGVFSFRYNTRFGSNTVTWNPIRMDYNGFVGIGMDPTVGFEVLGASKFNSNISATTIGASGGISALSFASTTGANFATTSGNVGIGGVAASKLHVFGNQLIENTSGAEMRIYNSSDANRAGYFSVTGDGDYSNRFVNIGSSSTAYGFRILNGATEFLRILNNGNTGIGTIAPTSLLHMKSGNPIIRLEGSTTSGYIDFNSTRMNIHSGSGYMTLTAGDAERLRILANGNTGIGTAAPISALHAVAEATVPKEVATFETSGVAGKPYINFRAENVNMGYLGWGAANNKMFMMNYNNASIELGTNSVSRVAITGTGAFGVGTTNPLSNFHLNSSTADVYSRFTGTGSANGGLMVGVGTINQAVFMNRENTDMEFYNNLSLKLIVKADGKVGIGTASPTYPFHVKSTDATVFAESNDGTAGIRINAQSNVAILETTTNSDLRIRTNAIERMRILTNGNVGIGTTSPGYKLQVEGNTRFNNSTFHENSTLIGYVGSRSGWTGGAFNSDFTIGAYSPNIIFSTNNTSTERMRIDANGNIGIGTTNTNAPLQFANSIANRKIVLWEDYNNDHQFFGFGLSSGVLRYQTATPGSSHVFVTGTGSGASQQLLSINGDQTVTYTPLTTSQINALTKVKGKMAYNSDTDKMVYCTGSAGVWKYFDGSNM